MKIGDTVWLFDGNRRIYANEGKNKFSAPIYREHFYPVKIEGETSRSWLIHGEKYSKTNPSFYTEQEKENDVWRNENKRSIVEAIESCTTDKLKEISKLLNS